MQHINLSKNRLNMRSQLSSKLGLIGLLFKTYLGGIARLILSPLLLAFLAFNASLSWSVSAQPLTVYSQNSKVRVAEVSDNNQFQIIRRDGRWSIVKFTQAAVPVWVSSDYLWVENSKATVTANRLNLRTGPSIESRVLVSVPQGYQSNVLGSASGFTQIYAPTELLFALTNADVERLSSDNSASPKGDTQNTMQGAPGSNWRTTAVPELATSSSSAQYPAPTKQSMEASETAVDVSKPQSDSNRVDIAVADEPAVPATSDETSTVPTSIERQHRLFPGDTIRLVVFGEKELSLGNIRIPQSGKVSFPLVGSLDVAGKTTSELEAVLRESLAQGYVRNPRLTVTIESYRPIFVLGAAQKIGSFAYSEGLTIAKAIAVAGGAKNSARENGISILRDGQIVHENLPLDSQMQVLSGDIITLEEDIGVSEKASSYVYLHGEVGKPGEYEYRRGLTVEKAIVLAGGFTLRASRRKISVSRIVEGENEPRKLKKVELYLPVEPGDIIDVGARWF
jgi:polysaccharide export outer membrane protein